MIYIILAVAAAVLVWAIVENTLLLLVRRSALSDGSPEVKIMQISDCHGRNNSRYNKKILRTASREKPDAIFITGDLVSRYETDFSACCSLLRRLGEIADVYMCFGNHEQSLSNEKQSEFLEILRKSGVRLLRNDCAHIQLKGRSFSVYGIELKYTTYKKNGGYKNLDSLTIEEMKALLGEPKGENVLLLAHNPLFAEVYAEWGADNVFSGHVHGGLVRLFGVGLLSPERRLFPEYSKGIYTISKTKVAVSAGIGKLRLFDPPEVNIFIL
ncbi:MAG: metallophosphoesterase [Alistipes sp.]|nr:metallophosphoesterase [Alistipes sp.]